MKLAEMQRLFHQLASRAPGSEAIDPALLFTGTAELDSSARIGIYADMFIWRQIDALRDDFPKLARVLGAGPFYAMAEDYLREHPSRHASLSELGRELPTDADLQLIAEACPAIIWHHALYDLALTDDLPARILDLVLPH